MAFVFERVYSSALEANKRWYALSSAMCGRKPSKFGDILVATAFPDEIRRVKAKDVRRQNGENVGMSMFGVGQRQMKDVFAATVFGIVAVVLRQKKLQC